MFFPFFILLLFLAGTTFGQAIVIDSLKNVIATEEKAEKKLKACQALVNEYSRTNMLQAKTWALACSETAKEQQLWALLSGFYTQLVSLHQNKGEQDSAQLYLTAIHQLSRKAGGEKDKILANYYSAAGLFYKKQGNYKAAIPYMLQAAKLAAVVSTPESTAGQYLNIGNSYMNLGDYKHALQYHLEALRLFEAAGSKKGESFCYQSIGEDFLALQRYQKALHYLQKSEALKTELGDKRGVGNALSGIGRSYLGLKNYALSYRYLSQALQTASSLQLVHEEVKLRLNLGQLFHVQNKTTDAMAYFKQAKNMALAIGDSAANVKADREIFALETKSKEKATTEKQLLQSIRTLRATGNRKEEVSLYKTLSDFYAKNGEAEKSRYFTAKHYQTKDSLLSRDVQLEISRMEEQYKNEKKEAEITLLKKDQQIIQSELKRQQQIKYTVLSFAVLLLVVTILLVNRYKIANQARRVADMEKMRNRIAKDLHDDIGSTLSSINIMSNVLLRKAQGGLTDINGLQKIKDHSAEIMENMDDIVWAINPHNDTAEKMIIKMKEFAAEMLDPLNIRYTFTEEGDVSKLALDPQMRRDLFLIFKEAINNAAKYSHCRQIDIVLSLQSHALQLTISDDGHGFDQVSVKKGNGLRNLEERSQAAGGSLTLTSCSGTGTAVQLLVPIT